jgi:hypothetical protein
MNRLIWGSLTFALILTANVQAQRQPGGGGGFGGRGARPLVSEKELEELKLSSKQKDTISAITKDYDAKQKEMQKEITDLFTGGGRPDMDKLTKLREAGTKAREEAETKLKAALDDDASQPRDVK